MLFANLTTDILDPESKPESCDGPNRTEGLKNDALAEHYAGISETLQICEAGSYRVGVPWIPPCSTVNRFAKKFYPPLDGFVRVSLVQIPTTAIISYCDDIECLIDDESPSQDLQLPNLTLYERYAFSGLLFGIFFCADLLMSNLFSVAPEISLGAASIVGFFAAYAGIVISSELQRLRSFHRLLSQELARRQGMGPIGTNGIPVMS